jgi:hypothetical protein
MDQLEYGKLIKTIGNIHFIQVNDKNTVIITVFEDYNEVEFYRSGVLCYK